MNILVLEDEGDKGQEIMQILQENKYPAKHKFCTDDIKRELQRTKYDIVILDLKVPKMNGQKKDITFGLELVQYIFCNTTDALYSPKAVLIITSFYDEERIKELQKFPVSIIPYKVTGEWKKSLLQQIKYFIGTKYDIAIITAVDVEFEAVFTKEWELQEDIKDLVYYKRTEINCNGEKIHMILVQQEQMGMVAATMLTSKIITYFDPKCVIMLGICAGRKGAVELGDMIFATTAWDYGSGSIEKAQRGNSIKFLPAPNYIQINEDLKDIFKRYKARRKLLCDFEQNIIKIASETEDTKLLKIVTKQQNKTNRIHLGAMATGAAVIKNEKFTQMFVKEQNKKYIGLDMETYGVYYAAQISSSRPNFFCIKCVSDVADEHKDDTFQKYCSLLANEMVKYYIKEDFIIE